MFGRSYVACGRRPHGAVPARVFVGAEYDSDAPGDKPSAGAGPGREPAPLVPRGQLQRAALVLGRHRCSTARALSGDERMKGLFVNATAVVLKMRAPDPGPGGGRRACWPAAPARWCRPSRASSGRSTTRTPRRAATGSSWACGGCWCSGPWWTAWPSSPGTGLPPARGCPTGSASRSSPGPSEVIVGLAGRFDERGARGDIAGAGGAVGARGAHAAAGERRRLVLPGRDRPDLDGGLPPAHAAGPAAAAAVDQRLRQRQRRPARSWRRAWSSGCRRTWACSSRTAWACTRARPTWRGTTRTCWCAGSAASACA